MKNKNTGFVDQQEFFPRHLHYVSISGDHHLWVAFKSKITILNPVKDMAQVNLSDTNTTKLLQIQKIILYEMGIDYSIDETLSYILNFYRKFVPYD